SPVASDSAIAASTTCSSVMCRSGPGPGRVSVARAQARATQIRVTLAAVALKASGNGLGRRRGWRLLAEQRTAGVDGGHRGTDDLPSFFHALRHIAPAVGRDRACDVARLAGSQNLLERRLELWRALPHAERAAQIAACAGEERADARHRRDLVEVLQ